MNDKKKTLLDELKALAAQSLEISDKLNDLVNQMESEDAEESNPPGDPPKDPPGTGN